MPNVIAFLVIVAIIIGVIVLLGRRAARPERRLLRDFRRLRRLILSSIQRPHRAEAERLLGGCESYLAGLLDARERHALLGSMAGAAAEMTGLPPGEQGQRVLEVFDRRMAEDLSGFFTSLTRISAVVGLQREETLDALRSFTEDLEIQREALAELADEFNQGPVRAIPEDRAVTAGRKAGS